MTTEQPASAPINEPEPGNVQRDYDEQVLQEDFYDFMGEGALRDFLS